MDDGDDDRRKVHTQALVPFIHSSYHLSTRVIQRTCFRKFTCTHFPTLEGDFPQACFRPWKNFNGEEVKAREKNGSIKH